MSMKEIKTALRLQTWDELARMTQEERDASNDEMFARFLALPEVENAKVFFAFWGMPDREPNTALLIEKLLERGKVVGLPLMRPGRQMEVRRYDPAIPLIRHKFGILEPSTECELIPKEDVDFVLTPAVAYDKQGYRLGFGGGYYDRWLEHYEGVKIGLCREKVLRDSVPVEPHDTHVDAVVTEKLVIRCK